MEEIVQKIFIYSTVLVLSYGPCGSQNKFEKQIQNISQIGSMPYGPELSGDSLFWELIKGKIDIVPELIEKLDDTTITKAKVPYFDGYYAVADIAHDAICEIIRGLPTMDLLRSWEEFDEDAGFGNYWRYVRDGYHNRVIYRERVRDWFNKHKALLIWVEDNELYLKEETKDAKRYRHPAGGYYELRK